MFRQQTGRLLLALVPLLSLMTSEPAMAQESSPDARARQTEQRMTDDERLALLVSYMGSTSAFDMPRDPHIPVDVTNIGSGYTPGVARLGIPALQSSDASMGVTNPGYRPDDPGATAFPASVLVGATFNPTLAREGGAAIGREARSRGFNVQLAGGMNLQRDPRNGRNFEYYSEDPLLSAVMAAEAVNGIQSQGVISTLKHFVLNANETNRQQLDAIIDPAALRESDLLAFQIALERSQPGSVMASYNKVNGVYTGDNKHLLIDTLKGAWGYPGYVMSDWGAVGSWGYALNGLDQESGIQLDVTRWGKEAFTDQLRQAHAEGKLPAERLSDMVRRILRSVYAVGVDQWGPAPKVDLARHNEIALETARQGIVLLANDGVLPLPADVKLKIAVIGGHAQEGVTSGIGSGAVSPVGGYAGIVKIGGEGVFGGMRNLYLLAPSPLAELKKALPDAEFAFDPGYTPAEAALTAARVDLAIVFATRVEGEGRDNADLSLPQGQDALIAAVASANPNTVVVLQTGNPVAMPWREQVKAIVQAWYPGQAGAQAIAEVLSGKVNPSGRLPMSFPTSLADTPRPVLPGLGTIEGTPTTIRYDEGAEVGYRWHAQKGIAPLFAFGHGLSYTRFAYRDLKVSGGDTVSARFTVSNTGARAGADVPQLYLTDAAGTQRMRLLGFERVELAPGESREVAVSADPRLLARFDTAAGQWRIAGGNHQIVLARSADAPMLTGEVQLDARLFGN